MFFVTFLEATLIYVNCWIVEAALSNQSHHINQSLSLDAKSTTSHTTKPKLLSSFRLEHLETTSTDSHTSYRSLNYQEATTLDYITPSQEMATSWGQT